MKAFKYIVILLCIVFIGGAVFYSLKDGSIENQQEVIIDAPAPLVYDALSNFSSWEQWNDHLDLEGLKDDQKMLLNDVDAIVDYKYNEDEFGTLKIASLDSLSSAQFDFVSKKGTSLTLNVQIDTTEGNATKLKTTVTGNRDLTDKIVADLFSDEITEEMIPALQEPFEKSLNSALQKMMAQFEISEPFETTTSGGYHLMMTQSTNLGYVQELRKKLEAAVVNYMRRQNIAASGPTKLIYDQVDQQNGTAIITVAVPVAEKIVTEVNSTIICAYKNPVMAVRCTLVGDIKNLDLAKTKINKFIDQQGLSRSSYAPWEVYRKDASDVYNPAEQITEVYIPVE